MNSNGARALLVAVTVVALVVAFVALRGGDDSPDASDGSARSGDVPTIVIEDGQPVGGVVELSYQKGSRARFVVDSDTTSTVHLHGYDIERKVRAGGRTTFDWTADADGIFEVELEESAVPIASVTVNP